MRRGALAAHLLLTAALGVATGPPEEVRRLPSPAPCSHFGWMEEWDPSEVVDLSGPVVPDRLLPVVPDRLLPVVPGRRLPSATDVLLVDPEDRDVRGHLVADYDGRYARDSSWPATLAFVEAAIPKAAAHVRERLGLGDLPEPPFLVRFRDREDGDYDFAMATFQEIHGDRVIPSVVIRTDLLVGRTHDIVKALRHEIAHCWHLEALGNRFYDVPRWVQEGLADWATGRGRDVVDRLCASYLADPSRGTGDLVDGLGGLHEGVDYGEDWLAFDYLEQETGIEGVRRFVRDHFQGTDSIEALRRVTGWEHAGFLRRAREYAAADVAGAVEERRWCLDGFEAMRRGRTGEARKGFARYLADPRRRVFRRRVLLDLAECDLLEGANDAALARLDEAEAEPPIGFAQDRVALLRLRVAAARGDWKEVERGALEYLRVFDDWGRDGKFEAGRLLAKARLRGIGGGGK